MYPSILCGKSRASFISRIKDGRHFRRKFYPLSICHSYSWITVNDKIFSRPFYLTLFSVCISHFSLFKVYILPSQMYSTFFGLLMSSH